MTAKLRARRAGAGGIPHMSVHPGKSDALETENGSQPTSGNPGRQWLILDDFPSVAVATALSPNGRAHWAAKRRARLAVEGEVQAAALSQHLRAVTGPVRLVFRYVYPTERKRDVDNLTTGVTKAAIDALVRGRWLEADDSEHVVGVRAEAAVQKGAARRLEITLEREAPGDGAGE